jgi:aerobic carbon-monoxide dehydrogenase medium subunit
MIPATVDYWRARSLEDALEALAEPEATAVAGGQSLLSVMKLRIARPRLVVDIGHLELRGVSSEDGETRLGALTVWDELARSSQVDRPAFAAIVDCAHVIGDLQVRNRGTIGGSLAHADPSSDMPAALLALAATLTLRSPVGTRAISLADFFLGPFTTALEHGELITEIVLPAPPLGSGSAYAKVEHPASGFALAGVAALVRPDGVGSLAVTGVGAQPFLLPAGDPDSAIAEAEIFGDDYAPEEYRRDLVSVLARRALERAAIRAEEDSRWRG